jgi:hypothetical protein
MASPQDEQLKVYEQLCNSYRAIDDFRAKLLGFLPLATGTGVFLLVTDRAKIEFMQQLFNPIGAFGFVITLGLFFYELYGIKKCTHLIKAGIALEEDLKIQNGQFTCRPPGVWLLINEPLAAGVIYPAVLAAWTFLALAFPQLQDAIREDAARGQAQASTTLMFKDDAFYWATRVFLVGFAVSMSYNIFLIKGDIRKKLGRCITWLRSLAKANNKQDG